MQTTRSTVSSQDIETLFRKLHAQRVQDLKEQIRADEMEYATLKNRVGENEQKVEVLSSTQGTVNEQVQTSVVSPEAEEATTSFVDSEMKEDVETDPTTEKTLHQTQDKSATTENAGDQALAQIQSLQVEDDQDAEDSEAAATAISGNASPEGSERAESQNEIESTSTPGDETMKEDQIDEIAVEFDTETSESALKLDTPGTQKLGHSVSESRKTRTRSSTLNTVTSTDTAINDELAADQLLKKRGSRATRNSTARDEGKSPSLPSGNDDFDAAAALKRFQSTIMPVLNNIASHRYASVFSNPVSDKEAPNYSSVVKCPMDIKKIRAQIKSGELANLQAFQRAVVLMLSNAVMYNPEEGEVTKMATELFDHAEVRNTTRSEKSTNAYYRK